jgi:hypothetical protein
MLGVIIPCMKYLPRPPLSTAPTTSIMWLPLCSTICVPKVGKQKLIHYALRASWITVIHPPSEPATNNEALGLYIYISTWYKGEGDSWIVR